MPRGHGEGKDRRERRHKIDRRSGHDQRDLRDGKPQYAHAHPENITPPEYTSTPDTNPEPRIRQPGRHSRRPSPGLNDDYYNPAPGDHEPSRRNKKTQHDRRRRHVKDSVESDQESDYLHPKSKRRSKTESRGRRHGKRYESDYTEEEDEDGYDSQPERPSVKPSRRKSFLNAMGIGKSYSTKTQRDNNRDRGRSPYRSPSRGRRSQRGYSYSPSPSHGHSYSPSPPRQRGSVRDPRTSRAPVGPGISRANTNWQRIAGSAMKAGASTAYELRHDRSPWVGQKGIRVATAAIGAAVMDSFVEEELSKRSGKASGGMRNRAMRGVSEAALKHIVSGSGRSRSHKRY